jgi:hypothetical protein
MPVTPLRHGNGGNGFAGASRVFYFLGRCCGSLLPVLLGGCYFCVLEN